MSETMDNNKVVARYKWDMDVVITIGINRVTRTIQVGPTGWMTGKEAEKAAEHIATHGVWWFEVLVPPHRIESITVKRAEYDDQG